MIKKINAPSKIVFPIAGLGTSLYPITKSISKALLPVVDKPLLQYAIDEAIEAGFTDLIFVINPSQSTIANYLTDPGNDCFSIPNDITCQFITQDEPSGLGHAILLTQTYLGNEPFGVLLPDELMSREKEHGCLWCMMNCFRKNPVSIVSIMEVSPNEIDQYGIAIMKDSHMNLIGDVYEKPSINSNLAITGRYIFTSTIFVYLNQIQPGYNHEMQLTDAMKILCTNETLMAFIYKGKRFDCGKKIGYIKAFLYQCLQREKYQDEMRHYVNELIASEEKL